VSFTTRLRSSSGSLREYKISQRVGCSYFSATLKWWGRNSAYMLRTKLSYCYLPCWESIAGHPILSLAAIRPQLFRVLTKIHTFFKLTHILALGSELDGDQLASLCLPVGSYVEVVISSQEPLKSVSIAFPHVLEHEE